jgi:hypothetical protein
VIHQPKTAGHVPEYRLATRVTSVDGHRYYAPQHPDEFARTAESGRFVRVFDIVWDDSDAIIHNLVHSEGAVPGARPAYLAITAVFAIDGIEVLNVRPSVPAPKR